MSSRRGLLVVLTLHAVLGRRQAGALSAVSRNATITSDELDWLLDALSGRYVFAGLDDVGRYLGDTRGLPDAVLLTADDGLVSISEELAPILERHRAKALAFVSTGLVGLPTAPGMFRLEHALATCRGRTLSLTVGTTQAEHSIVTLQDKRVAIDAVWGLLTANRESPMTWQPDHLAIDGRAWRLPDDDNQSIWQPATWSQLRVLVDRQLLQIGSHMVSHRPLPWLDADTIRHELIESKSRLEREFDVPVTACAYPHGMESSDIRRMTADVYQWGFITGQDIVRAGTPAMAVPRLALNSRHVRTVRRLLEFPALASPALRFRKDIVRWIRS